MSGFPTRLPEAEALARDLGLLGTTVFFGDWVPYADWPNVLLESDAALTLHPRDTLEARLAFRTRVLDYLWAGLPTVASRGDVLAELIEANGLGAVVPPEDPSAVAAGWLQVLAADRGALEGRFEAVRRTLTWEAAARPLVAFCRQPRLAADRLASGQRVGPPDYTSKLDTLHKENERLSQEAARLQRLVHWYENHKVIRLMRRFDPLVLRLGRLRRRANHG
jgi:hypothetical protein